MDSAASDRLYSIVASRLRDARKQRGISQDAVAAAIELKRSSIANFERGRQHLQLHNLYRFAAEVGLEVGDLFPSLAELRSGEVGASETVQVGEDTVEVPSHQAAFVREILGRETR